MTETNHAVTGHLYPEIASYVAQRTREFDQILSERKLVLQQLANYIRARTTSDRDAMLTFICTHNSRRSHMAQIWTQIAAARFGVKHVQTYSGGTEITACNPRTVDSLKRCGIRFSVPDVDGSNPHYSATFSNNEPPLISYSKIFSEAANPSSNYCAAMTCSRADQHCPVAIGCDLRLAIRYDDPKVSDDTPQEAASYDERCAQIAREMLYAMSKV